MSIDPRTAFQKRKTASSWSDSTNAAYSGYTVESNLEPGAAGAIQQQAYSTVNIGEESWDMYYSPEGYPYYFNARTGESVWASDFYYNNPQYFQPHQPMGNPSQSNHQLKAHDTRVPKEESDSDSSEEDDDNDDSDSSDSEEEGDGDIESGELPPEMEERFRAYLRTPQGRAAMEQEQRRLSSKFSSFIDPSTLEAYYNNAINTVFSWGSKQSVQPDTNAQANIDGEKGLDVEDAAKSDESVSSDDSDVQIATEPAVPSWLTWQTIREKSVDFISRPRAYINADTIQRSATTITKGLVDITTKTFETLSSVTSSSIHLLRDVINSQGSQQAFSVVWGRINQLLVQWVENDGQTTLPNNQLRSPRLPEQSPRIVNATPRAPSGTPRIPSGSTPRAPIVTPRGASDRIQPPLPSNVSTTNNSNTSNKNNLNVSTSDNMQKSENNTTTSNTNNNVGNDFNPSIDHNKHIENSNTFQANYYHNTVIVNTNTSTEPSVNITTNTDTNTVNVVVTESQSDISSEPMQTNNEVVKDEAIAIDDEKSVADERKDIVEAVEVDAQVENVQHESVASEVKTLSVDEVSVDANPVEIATDIVVTQDNTVESTNTNADTNMSNDNDNSIIEESQVTVDVVDEENDNDNDTGNNNNNTSTANNANTGKNNKNKKNKKNKRK